MGRSSRGLGAPGRESRCIVRIQEFAALSGTPARSLRYYEQQDLIRPERLANGYRSYEPDLVERVVLIRELIDTGIPTRVIREMIPCLDHPDRPVVEPTDPVLLAMLTDERDRMERRIEVLTRSCRALTRYIDRVRAAAAVTGGSRREPA
jgi:DNA-binding transcriptional MerR regulator